MANLMRYPDLELPVFDVSYDEVIDCMDFKTQFIPTPSDDRFLRHVKLTSESATENASLTEILDKADECFDHVAHLVGAEVIAHTWGLIRVPEEDSLDYNSRRLHLQYGLVPEGHLLVAQVETLRDVTGLSHEQLRHISAQADYYSAITQETIWYDFSVKQFVNGVAPNEEQARLWLPDIDPVIRTYDNGLE